MMLVFDDEVGALSCFCACWGTESKSLQTVAQLRSIAPPLLGCGLEPCDCSQVVGSSQGGSQTVGRALDCSIPGSRRLRAWLVNREMELGAHVTCCGIYLVSKSVRVSHPDWDRVAVSGTRSLWGWPWQPSRSTNTLMQDVGIYLLVCPFGLLGCSLTPYQRDPRFSLGLRGEG